LEQRGPKVAESYQVRAVLRAMDLLDTFTPVEPELGLAQLADRANLCASTTYRLLQTLESRRFVEHDPQTGRYRLGLACLRLGEVAIVKMDLRERLRPLLLELRDDYREAVHLAILDLGRMEVSYLDKLDGLLPIGMAYAGDAVVEAHYRETAPRIYTPSTIADWAALAAHLAEVRRVGYALDNVEHEPDVKCIAVPVRNHFGTVACSVSISGPEARMDKHIAEDGLVDRMLRLATEASSRLGHTE
jgi:IclR family KDG regulon transcriptional repressor